MKALTTNQVAEILNCNLQRVQILIREGKLPAINIAVGEKKPRWRVPQSVLDDFMTPTNRPVAKPIATRKRQRIDASVPKVFG